MTTPDMGSYEYAMQFKELIAEMVTAELNRQRPTPTYATVQSINETERSCMVVINGDTVAVKAYCASIIPAAVGQIVRLEGTPGDRYIADVQGETMDNAYIPWLDIPSRGTGVTANAIDVPKYRVIRQNGLKKVQLKGRLDISGTRTLMWTMPVDARPVVNIAPILVAREYGGGSNTAQLDVLASGAVNLVGQTTTPAATTDSNRTSGALPDSISDSSAVLTTSNHTGHKHWLSDWLGGPPRDFTPDGNNGAHTHTVPAHTHGIGHDHTFNHSHTVTPPTFISLNGVEYFI